MRDTMSHTTVRTSARPGRGWFPALGATLFLIASGLQAQGPSVTQAPPSLLKHFDATAGTLQQLDVPFAPQEAFVVEVVLAGTVHQLQLEPYDVRAPGFQLLIADQNGIRQEPTPPSVTYRGGLSAVPASIAAATVVEGLLTAVVVMPDGGTWAIQAVRPVQPTASPRLHVVFHGRDTRNLPFRCGTTGPSLPVEPLPMPEANAACQIACEGDFPFYQLNGGNTTTTQNNITGIVNGMDSIYRSDVQIQYSITTILVRTTTDPYTTTNASGLLSQFQSQWNTFHGSIQRDVAHLFTGRSLDGSTIGIAILGTVCNLSSAYGLAQSMFSGNYAARVALSSHEVGHNWNASHCDGQPDCRIMCSGLGGCTGVITSFGQSEKNQILAFKSTRTCLSLPPTITGLLPNAVQAFQPQTVLIAGSGFSGATQVRVGAVNATYTVLNDNQIQLTPPSGLTIGMSVVTVTTPLGVSNGVVLTYNPTSPPRLAAPATVVGGTNLTLNYGGLPNDHYYLLVSISNATVPWMGWPLLQSWSILSINQLNAVGIGTFSTAVPPGFLTGLTVYTQMIDVIPVPLSLAGTTNIPPTLIQ